jgi:hypothetical protein
MTLTTRTPRARRALELVCMSTEGGATVVALCGEADSGNEDQ